MGLEKNKKRKWKRNEQSSNIRDAGVTHKDKVYISKKLNQLLIAECKKELPNEACGFISGHTKVCKNVWPTKNTNPSPYTFAIDIGDQDRILSELKKNNEELVGVYHSHPFGKAVPSNDDIKYAPSQHIYYFIIALGRGEADIRCYKIFNGNVREFDIEIIG
ncbi:M67 family metallopeptidase [Rossellomorea aquimaris]|uniref:Proteasome lid subunit RPN8/RPN11 n=1 Tax=Rossellomorea aquimaris TaxID=189382 RepID=A0A366EWL6_9BACI|nr:M67 family metallopeptidase [Rossellomorea aquimaris]RBP06734.1 proteasome lid subunit RPN8/RPN11 [Rossellomorea aquimaris]